MTRPRPEDPTVLDPAGVAYHQLLAFPARPELADALERSPLFGVRRHGNGATCEWLQFSAESDPSPFPLARIRSHREGVLLEAFSERRLSLLRRAAREAGAGEIAADQLRVFRVADALADPARLIQPLHDASGEPLTPREVAADYLRMAWAWIPRDELGNRPPASVVGTGRGRALLEPVLDTLGRALRSEIPTFPAMSSDELHEILLPEARPRTPAPAPPRSARNR
ncbi:MAG TPA: hypothetical protein VKU85_21440 [bacterium]|nr:hypothetical protein [bacterium]